MLRLASPIFRLTKNLRPLIILLMPNLTVDPQPQDNNSSSLGSNPLKAIFIGILMFVLLSATAFGAYWYTKSYLIVPSSQPVISWVPTQTPQPKNSFSNLSNQVTPAATDETAGWKTHMSKSLGLSFRYTDSMEVLECNGIIYPVLKERHYDPCQSDAGGFSISSTSSTDLPDWYYRDYKISKSVVVVDSVSSQRFKGVRSSNTPAPIPNEVDVIIVPLKTFNLFIDTVNESILPTFKFLN